MSPLPDVHLGAGVPFYVLLGVFLALEQRIRWRSIRNRGGERLDRGSLFVLVAAIGAGIAGAFVLAPLPSAGSLGAVRWPAFVVGLVLMLAGIGLRQWSVALLGASFTVDVRIADGQAVVDRGPYRWVRHPSYSGMLLTFSGIGLALGSWLSLACAVLLPLAGLVVRIRVEEAALVRGLGAPYTAFATGRARLVPFVW